jgi:hypothetical protein
MKPMSALRIIETVFQVVGTGFLIGAAVCAANPPSFEVGERVRVLVSKDGSRQSTDSFAQIGLLPISLGGFGVVFGGIGFAFPIVRRRKAEFARYVKSVGETVESSDVEVLINRHYAVNDRHPWYLRCKARVDGVEMVFKSGNIWEDPSTAVADRRIRIHYLRNDPEKHLVDIGFLDEGTRLGE